MKKIITAGLVFVGVVTLGASYYVSNKTAETNLLLQLKVSEQEKTLVSLAELVNVNGADSVVSAIVKDCSVESRDRFENLLNSLGSLRGADLQEVDQLFEACGGFFAARKSAMVARFERELGVYEDYIELYDTLDNRADKTLYPIADWRQLVAIEAERAVLLRSQVEVQGAIITALQAGETTTSENITSKLTEAENIVQNFTVLDARAQEIRKTLLDV